MVSEPPVCLTLILIYYGSLNPCSCGGWSQSHTHEFTGFNTQITVLILVLVEDGLRALSCIREEHRKLPVLILVLVEDGLRDLE